MRNPVSSLYPRLYKHFKGGLYIYLGEGHIATNGSDEDESVVVYKNVDDGKLWIRSKSEFFSDVDKEKYPNTEQTSRFQLIDLLQPMYICLPDSYM